MATKIVCDICGKDATGYDFVFPVHDEQPEYEGLIFGAHTSMKKQLMEKQTMNLCIPCRAKIADFIKSLKQESQMED